MPRSSYGFELGEELTGYRSGTAAFEHYTQAYHECAELLRQVWPEPSRRPKLMGPCPGMAWPELAHWFPAFLRETAGALDVADYHSCHLRHIHHYRDHQKSGSTEIYLRLAMPTLMLTTLRRYNQIRPTPPRVLYLNTSVPSGNLSRQHGASAGGQGWQAAAMASYAAASNVSELWLGEGADHNGGG
jgi:hypothetical protein